jgi:hypothetical protein
VLAILGVVSATSAPSAPAAVAPPAAAAGVGAESTAAFCAGLEDVAGVVRSVVTVADVAGAARSLEVTTTDEHERVAHRLVALRPGHVVRLDPAHLLRGSNLAMSLVADGGGVVATEALTGVDGTAVAPCLTAPGPTWVATGGSTEPGASLHVAVFNPSTTSAEVTVSFLTPNGFVEPTRYHGLVLGPHHLAGLVVHDVAPNRSPITTIVSATAGNVVAFTVGRSTRGGTGISLLAGAPLPATTAVLPVTPNHAGATSALVLANPGATPVTASVRVSWTPGCGAHCAAPIPVMVGPGETTTLQLTPSARAPIGVPTATMLTASAPGLVIAQRVTTKRALGATSPLDDPTGHGATDLALVDPTGAGFDRVAIANTTTSTATVQLESPGPHGMRTHGTVVVPAGGVAELSRSQLRWLVGGVLLLSSDTPVFATGLVGQAVLGSDLLPGVPLS